MIWQWFWLSQPALYVGVALLHLCAALILLAVVSPDA